MEKQKTVPKLMEKHFSAIFCCQSWEGFHVAVDEVTSSTLGSLTWVRYDHLQWGHQHQDMHNKRLSLCAMILVLSGGKVGFSTSTNININIPVVPHKAVAEVSKIGNL